MKFWNRKVGFSLPAASRFYLWWKPRSVVVAFSWVVADQILPPQVQFESEFFLGYLEKFPRNDWEISSMKCEMLWNRKIAWFISLILSFLQLSSSFFWRQIKFFYHSNTLPPRMFGPWSIWAVNHHNHKNLVPSILTHNLWLIFIGMKLFF